VSDCVRSGNGKRIVVARLVRSADFERVLRTRTRVSSAHFAVHHVIDRPSRSVKPALRVNSAELSTTAAMHAMSLVDDLRAVAPSTNPGTLWLGAVVPKRHARRSVMRTLLKRQIRAVVSGHAELLAGGLWVVRLRAPFDRSRFVSASSEDLKRAARTELEQLMCNAVKLDASR
jgi:ribonuclease P protein component